MSSNSTAIRQRLKIGLDVDGVLAKFHDKFVAEYNSLSGGKHTLSDICAWDSTKWKMPMPIKEFLAFHDRIWTEKWAEIDPSINPKLLYYLASRHDVEILTHRPISQQEHLSLWLEKHFPEISLCIKCVRTAEEKIHSGHDILFDDGNPIAEELIHQGRKSELMLYLVNQPWNKDAYYGKQSANIIPVESLEDGIRSVMRNSE